jgi:L-threonylcarbamoyladenylate synthase
MIFEPKNIINIANQITRNKIGLFPFDTLFGLTGLPTQETINKLEDIKQRRSIPFIMIIPSLSFLDNLIEPLNKYQNKLITNYWPGPFTFIFKKKESVSDFITSGKPTIAIRFANFLPLNFLLAKTNSPILSTSANIHSEVAPAFAKDIRDSVRSKCDFCYSELAPKFNQCSTIVDITSSTPLILRQGVGIFND